MSGLQQDLPVMAVELDRDNPRIRRFLEAYDGEVGDDHIALALDVAAEAGEDGSGATSPEKLRNSILANGGIMQPIIVNRRPDGRLVCIEGRTRACTYTGSSTPTARRATGRGSPPSFTKASLDTRSTPSDSRPIWSVPARGTPIPRPSTSGSFTTST